MMKTGLIILVLFFAGKLFGQSAIPDTSNISSLESQDVLDSLITQEKIGSFEEPVMVPDTISIESLGDVFMVNSPIPDSIYIQRLSNIVSPIPFVYNEKVKSYIELYTQRRRDQVENMLGMSDYYFPIFEAALDANDMPLELRFLPIIESALNTKARSRAGAMGLWQFMYYTGKQYGLEINSYVDQRLDPVAASAAAVHFLKDLYAIYGDWPLAIAAYNCGPGNVNKAIRRSGGKRDFWQIFYNLPKETRGYVPAFIAAGYTFNYYKDHNILPKPTILPPATDTILVSKMLNFKQIASVLNISVESLRELNPQYRRDVIPGGKTSYQLRLPVDIAISFASLEDSIYNYEYDKYFSSKNLVVNPTHDTYDPVIPANRTKVHYTVKSGDAIGLIADWFDVNVSDLRYWNNINLNMIRAGQQLVVYVPKNRVNEYESLNAMSYAQKQKSDGKEVASITSIPESEISLARQADDGSFIYYTVRNGDNLWVIAKKFPGVSNSDIMALNNISDARKISVGQRLKIKKKS